MKIFADRRRRPAPAIPRRQPAPDRYLARSLAGQQGRIREILYRQPAPAKDKDKDPGEGGKAPAPASPWGRKHNQGPRLLDEKNPSYQVWFDHLVPKAPSGASQMWQVVERDTLLLTDDCTVTKGKSYVVDVVDLGSRTEITDDWGWIPAQDKTYCLALEDNKATVGFGPSKYKYAQQTSVEVTASLAQRLLRRMVEPKTTYSGRYTFVHTGLYVTKEKSKCPDCAKMLELKKQLNALWGEHLKIDGVGEWATA